MNTLLSCCLFLLQRACHTALIPTDKGEDEEQPPWLQKPLMSTDKGEDEERPPRLQKPLDEVPEVHGRGGGEDEVPDVHGPGGGQERPLLGSQKPPRTSC